MFCWFFIFYTRERDGKEQENAGIMSDGLIGGYSEMECQALSIHASNAAIDNRKQYFQMTLSMTYVMCESRLRRWMSCVLSQKLQTLTSLRAFETFSLNFLHIASCMTKLVFDALHSACGSMPSAWRWPGAGTIRTRNCLFPQPQARLKYPYRRSDLSSDENRRQGNVAGASNRFWQGRSVRISKMRRHRSCRTPGVHKPRLLLYFPP